jgi:hypothetical protein
MKPILQRQTLKRMTTSVALLALPLLGFAAGGPAGCLIVASQQLGNDTFGDWTGTNIVWGPGYPKVTVTVDTDESLVFGNGVQRQGMADFPTVLGTAANDNPNFTGIYRSDVAMNGILTDSGTMTIRYDFEFATQLVDIMLFDIDQTDVVKVEIFGMSGEPLAATNLALVAEGDISLNFNNSSRPQSELSTPPSWNPMTGTLTSRVSWNENRSYTVLRPGVPISSILITATGTIPAPDANSVGSSVLTALWATPREFKMSRPRRVEPNKIELSWPSLPGIQYEILARSDFGQPWEVLQSITGAASPSLSTSAVLEIPVQTQQRFYQVRW